jgi:hypothetical protein
MRGSRDVDLGRALLGGGALLLAMLGRERLEAGLLAHLFVQFPLLLAAGALLGGPRLPTWLGPWNRGGATGLALAAAILAFWMLPRVIHASVGEGRWAFAKFVALPLGGAALAWSLPLAPWLARQFLALQTIAMAAAMGWLYLALPERLCLRYLRSEQDELGAAFLIVAVTSFFLWLVRVLWGPAGSPTILRPGRPFAAEASL